MPEPIPVFHKSSVRSAVSFQRQQGNLRRLRKPPKAAPSRAPEIEYFRRINALFAELRKLISTEVIANIHSIVQGAPLALRMRQDVGEVLEEAIGKLRLAFAARAPLEMIARTAGNSAEAKNQSEQKRIVETVLGIRPEIGEPWLEEKMRQFTKSNARLIGNVSDDFIDRVERRISDRISEGIRAEDIAKEIEKDFISSTGLEVRKARNRAKLIARDQVASFQGDITRVRQQALGVSRYIWRTALDERVRGFGKAKSAKGSHSAREGKVFVWGEDFNKQLRAHGLTPANIDGPPGKPINCRCYAEPVLEDLVEDLPSI